MRYQTISSLILYFVLGLIADFPRTGFSQSNILYTEYKIRFSILQYNSISQHLSNLNPLIRANFHEFKQMYEKVKYCQENKDSYFKYFTLRTPPKIYIYENYL
jgi:hypothetical protein